MVGHRRASMDVPAPGGPKRRTLGPPLIYQMKCKIVPIPLCWDVYICPSERKRIPRRERGHSRARRSGAHILMNREVTRIQSQSDDPYRIETCQGSYQAATLVIAAGAWCGGIGAMLGLRIPIVPVRGQMWASDPLPPRLFHTISAAESSLQWHSAPGNDTQTPSYLTHRGQQRLTRHLYGRQTRTGEIIFGGDRQLVEYQRRP